MNTVSYTFRIPEELLADIDATAGLLGVSRAQVIIKRLEGGRVECRYVYLMRKGPLHKIGISRDPDVRKTQVGSGVELIWCEQSPLAASMELAYHAHFASKRIRGEWFDLSPEDIEWLKTVELYHPRQGDFVSAGVSCKCHPPKFVKSERWNGFDWVRCLSSWNRVFVPADPTSATDVNAAQEASRIARDIPKPIVFDITQNGNKPDMAALRAICAGKTNRMTYEETVTAVGLPEPVVEVPICGRTWWENGEQWECLMDAGHKELKHGMRGMVKKMD